MRNFKSNLVILLGLLYISVSSVNIAASKALLATVPIEVEHYLELANKCRIFMYLMYVIVALYLIVSACNYIREKVCHRVVLRVI